MIVKGQRVNVYVDHLDNMTGEYGKKLVNMGEFVDFGIDLMDGGMYTCAIVIMPDGFLCSVAVENIQVVHDEEGAK